jgi:hypothetical protein
MELQIIILYKSSSKKKKLIYYLNSAGLNSKETESPVKIVVTRLFHFNNFHQLG